jgi:hypothetical protein
LVHLVLLPFNWWLDFRTSPAAEEKQEEVFLCDKFLNYLTRSDDDFFIFRMN